MQDDIAQAAIDVFPKFRRFDKLYANTGIEARHICMPWDWYLQPRGWKERTAAFQEHGLNLLEEAARAALDDASLEAADIDCIVVNTVTGLAVPSLDALLANRMGFRPDIERLPIFGFGCGGGAAGLSRAAQLAHGDRKVLFLTVDLCTLTLRVNAPTIEMFVACALFGDGAAAVVIEAGGSTTGKAEVIATGEHMWPGTQHLMGWDVADDGFALVLSPDLPAHLTASLEEPLTDFLARSDISAADLDGYLFHPGGSRVLDALQEILDLSDEDLFHSRDTLRAYGNMSSATVLFVLKSALASGASGRHLLAAFGPGFSAYFMLLDLG
ncbi:type III polyketide synthase [Tepidamorphus sp. 3E244]|uniref:type III polyketide synthase n=1 Tax=Tepidamorphus sp. 3E244 TaxID=3385498 RepID=UPI0038FCD880